MPRTPVAIKWLIETQLSLRRVELDAEARGDSGEAKALRTRRLQIERVWRGHPLYFELDEPASGGINKRQRTLHSRVLSGLSATVWQDVEAVRQATHAFGTGAALRSGTVQKALQQLLLEGVVIHKFAEDGRTIIWRRVA